MRPFLLIAALTVAPFAAPASAQTVTTIDASVKFPTIVQTAANLINLLSQGVQVSFLTPAAQPAATLNSTGGIRITGSNVATPLTQVQVSTTIPGTTQVVKEIYPLAQPITATGTQTIAPQSIVVKAADGQQVPLVNVMGRQAAWAKAPGLQRKVGGMPPGQLKQLCRSEPKNVLCKDQPKQPGNWKK